VPFPRRPPNPLNSEADAFGCLLWALGLIALVVIVVVIARAV
jgi:hypothetical protein